MNNSDAFSRFLGLGTRPVAITFSEEKPAGLDRAGLEPAGCGYWRRAAEGDSFYTEASDHFECPIGAHTHGVEVPESRKKELEEMLGQMCDLDYISMSEVGGIPRLERPLRYATYAPLDRIEQTPDVVLFKGNARDLMLLSEAALAAGVAGESPALGRPTCAVIPAALQSGKTAASFGCIGNRVYTASRDEDAYFAVPGNALAAVAEKLAIIAKANKALEAFHRERAA
jgi:uncharacterized protein (DUF169 family)